MLIGTVVKGKALGRQIGFPTANLQITESYKLIPKQGVYVVSSVIADVVVFGMMNIGINPTVDGNKQTIEVHFFDFNKDIYEREIQVDVLYHIRDEQKFKSLEALKLQLQKDKETSLKYIKKHHA